MVNALNHTQPYLLTDNVWFPAADGAQTAVQTLASGET